MRPSLPSTEALLLMSDRSDKVTTAQASALLEAGISIIPIKPDGSKSPALSSWKPYQERHASAADVQTWYGNGHRYGVAAICGPISGNLEILDFDDPKIFRDFYFGASDTGRALIDSLPRERTPSGGVHLAYRLPEAPPGNLKLAQREEAGKPVTLIETRGTGGYAIIAPTAADCSPDGAAWTMEAGDYTALPVVDMEQRDALIALATSFNEYTSHVENGPRLPLPRACSPGHKRPGDAYNETDEYKTLLVENGWRRLRQQAKCEIWQRPGKRGKGGSATTDFGGSKCFYCFSSNAFPFAAGNAYSPFAVFTLLAHRGDYAAAAAALSKAGYGDPIPDESAFTGDVSADELEAEGETLALAPERIDPSGYWGIIGDLVGMIESQSEADPAAILLQSLVCFGNIIGRSAYFLMEDTRHHGNLFACVVGQSAQARKGTSWGRVERVFTEVDKDWMAGRVWSGLASGEGLIVQVKDDLKDWKTNKDGELEEIVKEYGVEDKRLLCMEGEFGGVLRVLGREGNTLSAIIRAAWDSGKFRTMTVNPRQATGAHVSIIGHITREELQRYLNAVETTNGLANRFLWCYARRTKILPMGGYIPAEHLTPLVDKIRDAVIFAETVEQMRFNSHAEAIWIDVYPDLTREIDGIVGTIIARAAPQTLRLACLYALLDQSDTIRPEHLYAALAVWNYCEQSAAYIFGISLDPMQDKILKALLAEAPHGLKKGQIINGFSRNIDAMKLNKALAGLAQKGFARREKVKEGRGRPSEVWYSVNRQEVATDESD